MSNISSASDMFSALQDIQLRSQQSAAKLAQDDMHGSWTAIGFRIGEHHLLIPLDETREVFTVPSQITAVPKSQPWVHGIANLRGELLPLFDLNYFLYGRPTKVSRRSRIVVNNHPSIYSGLLLDEVFGLKYFPEKPEAYHDNSDSILSDYITGQIHQQDTQWDVFSFSKLVSDLRFLNAAA